MLAWVGTNPALPPGSKPGSETRPERSKQGRAPLSPALDHNPAYRMSGSSAEGSQAARSTSKIRLRN